MAEERRNSLYLKVVIGVGAVALFAVFTWLGGGDSNFGAAAAFSVCAVAFAASVRWDLRRAWYYWASLALVSVAHLALIMSADLVLPKPTITVAPLVILDATLIVILLGALDRVITSEHDDS